MEILEFLIGFQHKSGNKKGRELNQISKNISGRHTSKFEVICENCVCFWEECSVYVSLMEFGSMIPKHTPERMVDFCVLRRFVGVLGCR